MCRADMDCWKGKNMLRCVHQICGERKEADSFGWRKEWCWLGNITFMQNTSIILQACCPTLVLGSTCTLGPGSWGPSLLRSSLTSSSDTSLMWMPRAARLNFVTQRVFFWSYSRSYPLFLLNISQLYAWLSHLHWHTLNSPGLSFFCASAVIFPSFQYLQTKHEKLTEMRKLCQTWLEKTSIS